MIETNNNYSEINTLYPEKTSKTLPYQVQQYR